MSEPEFPPVPAAPSPAELRARQGRNIALALGLMGFVILVFVITIVKLGANVIQRPL